MSESQVIDQEALYGVFLDSDRQQRSLQEDAVRKALNLPRRDDMNITTHQHGGGWQAMLLGAAMLAAGGGGALGIAALAGFGPRTGAGPPAPGVANRPAPRSPHRPDECVARAYTPARRPRPRSFECGRPSCDPARSEKRGARNRLRDERE